MDAALQACQAQAGADQTHWFFRDAARPGGWSRPHTPAGLVMAVLRAHCSRAGRSARGGELGPQEGREGFRDEGSWIRGLAPHAVRSVWLSPAVAAAVSWVPGGSRWAGKRRKAFAACHCCLYRPYCGWLGWPCGAAGHVLQQDPAPLGIRVWDP